MKTQRSLLLLLLTGLCIDGYKPVIIVHGILDGPKELKMLPFFINKVGQLKNQSLKSKTGHGFAIKVFMYGAALCTINLNV